MGSIDTHNKNNYVTSIYNEQMGVRKLNKYLTDKGIVKSYRNISEFIKKLRSGECVNNTKSGKIVFAVDFWLYVHKFLHSNRFDNILFGFFNQITRFLSSGVIPLYVIDGSAPIEKMDVIERRVRKRDNYQKKLDDIDHDIDQFININDLVIHDKNIELDSMIEKREKIHKHIKRIKSVELFNIYKLFYLLGIPYIKAEFEADAMCAKLYKEKLISCCLSDDMDMLALGCGSTIKFHEGKLLEYNMDTIKSNLKFTQEQIIDMCIMFGCDYLKHPLKIDCNETYELLKKHGSLIDALSSNEHKIFNLNNRNVHTIGDNYYQVKELYLTSSDREYIPSEYNNIIIRPITSHIIISFLKTIESFDTNSDNIRSIEYNIRKINELIKDLII
jgi:5'-3' exonuclease